MSERLTEIMHKFQVEGDKFRIILIKPDLDMVEKNIQILGNEFIQYLLAEGQTYKSIFSEHRLQEYTEEYNPEFSDPEANHRIDFSNIKHWPSLYIQELIHMNEVQVIKTERNISLSNMTDNIREVFNTANLNNLFDIYFTNEAYKKAMLNQYVSP